MTPKKLMQLAGYTASLFRRKAGFEEEDLKSVALVKGVPFIDEDKPDKWFIQVMKNGIIDYITKQERKPRKPPHKLGYMPEIPYHESFYDDSWEWMMKKVDERSQKALTLRYKYGLQDKDICKKLGIGTSYLSITFSRSFNYIREAIENHDKRKNHTFQ